MIIAIIALSILCLILIGVIIILYKVIPEVINWNEIPIYPCSELWVLINYNQKNASTITDFSIYDNSRVVALIINLTEPPTEEEKRIAGKWINLGAAVVYQLNDTWLWKTCGRGP